VGSITAHLLIGTSHRYHGGINFTHQVFVHENDRPVLQMVPAQSGDVGSIISWIPTVEDMLEDALLMACVYAIKDAGTGAEFAKARGLALKDYFCLYEIDAIERARLYDLSRVALVEHGVKLVFTILEGSTLRNQIGRLKMYPFEMEVCVPIYSRTLSAMSNEFREEGSLS